jgi:hypothetical protein
MSATWGELVRQAMRGEVQPTALDLLKVAKWRDWHEYRIDAIEKMHPPISVHPNGKPCHYCGCESWAWFRQVIATGARRTVPVCTTCGHMGESVKGSIVNPETLPQLEDRTSGTCEHCGASGTERHHWAPWHLFSDADRWPTSELCRKCHREWHRTVTPNMAKRGAA